MFSSCFQNLLPILIVAISLVPESKAAFGYYKNKYIENSTDLSRAKWDAMGLKWKIVISNMIDEVWPIANSSEEFVKLSYKCRHSFEILVKDVKEMKLWAVEMIDATPFWSGGRAFGSWSSYGAYEQCLGVERHSSKQEGALPFPITGQYCLIDFRPPLPQQNEGYQKPATLPGMEDFQSNFEFIEDLSKRGWEFYLRSFRYGACVPSTCNQNEVEILANAVAGRLNFNAMVPWCEKNDPKPAELNEIITTSVLAIFIFLAIGSTMSDYIINRNEPNEQQQYKNNGKFLRIMYSFSIPRNINRAMSDPKLYSSTAHLNGIKVLSIIWVFCNHSALILFFSLNFNDSNRFLNYSTGFLEQIFANGLIAIEIFFFMTAFITTFALLQTKNLHKKPGVTVEIIVPFFKRALKLLLLVLLATAVIISLMQIGDGPIHQFMFRHFKDVCSKNWWYILFFGTNYQDIDQVCLTASWYVSADIQLFIVCLFYVFLYKRKRIISYLLIALLMVISVISSAVIQHYRKNPPNMHLKGVDIPNWIKYFTDNHYPQDHFFSYGSGIILATFLSQRQKISLSNWKKMVGWVVSLLLGGYVLFGSYPWNKESDYTQAENLLFITFQKIFLSLSLLWLTFVCATGNAGTLNRFLSSKTFSMLGKLVLMVFLNNLTVISILIWGLDTVLSSNKLYIFMFVIQALIVTVILSVILHLFYELPLTELLNILTGNRNDDVKTELKIEDQSESNVQLEACENAEALRA